MGKPVGDQNEIITRLPPLTFSYENSPDLVFENQSLDVDKSWMSVTVQVSTGDVLRNIMLNTDTLQYTLGYDTLEYQPKEVTPLKISVNLRDIRDKYGYS